MGWLEGPAAHLIPKLRKVDTEAQVKRSHQAPTRFRGFVRHLCQRPLPLKSVCLADVIWDVEIKANNVCFQYLPQTTNVVHNHGPNLSLSLSCPYKIPKGTSAVLQSKGDNGFHSMVLQVPQTTHQRRS